MQEVVKIVNDYFHSFYRMADPQEDQELLDYDEEDAGQEQQTNGADAAETKKGVKGSYVSIHSSGFRDFLLKPELLRAIVDCGFEHPSEGMCSQYVLCNIIFLFCYIFCMSFVTSTYRLLI